MARCHLDHIFATPSSGQQLPREFLHYLEVRWDHKDCCRISEMLVRCCECSVPTKSLRSPLTIRRRKRRRIRFSARHSRNCPTRPVEECQKLFVEKVDPGPWPKRNAGIVEATGAVFTQGAWRAFEHFTKKRTGSFLQNSQPGLPAGPKVPFIYLPNTLRFRAQRDFRVNRPQSLYS